MTTKERYDYNKSHGICTECRKVDAIPGRIRCQKCNDLSKERGKKYFEILKSNPELYQQHLRKKRKYSREKYCHDINNGICVNCGKIDNMDSDHTRCIDCRKIANKSREKWYIKNRSSSLESAKDVYKYYKDNGICVRCHQRNSDDGNVLCSECNQKDYKGRKIKYVKWKNSHRYQEYLERNREPVNIRYRQRKESGLCVICGKNKAQEDVLYCVSCRARLKNYQRIRYKLTHNKRDDVKILSSLGLCYICSKPVKEGMSTTNKPYKVCEEHHRRYIGGLANNKNDREIIL